jgi:hypothetical protein
LARAAAEHHEDARAAIVRYAPTTQSYAALAGAAHDHDVLAWQATDSEAGWGRPALPPTIRGCSVASAGREAGLDVDKRSPPRDHWDLPPAVSMPNGGEERPHGEGRAVATRRPAQTPTSTRHFTPCRAGR